MSALRRDTIPRDGIGNHTRAIIEHCNASTQVVKVEKGITGTKRRKTIGISESIHPVCNPQEGIVADLVLGH